MLLFVGNALYDVTREEWWGNFLHGVNSGSSVTVLFLKPRLVTKTKRMVNVITRAGAIVKSKTVPKRTFGPRKIYGRYRGGVIRKKVGRPFLMRNIQLIGYIVSNLSWKWIEKIQLVSQNTSFWKNIQVQCKYSQSILLHLHVLFHLYN